MKLSVNLRVWTVIQCQFEIIISWPVWQNITVGTRLVIKAYETVFFTYDGYLLLL